MAIEGAPQVFGFGYARLNADSIAIYGGSDGNLITSSLYTVDFSGKKAQEVRDVEESDETAMSCMFYREESKKLYTFGGNTDWGYSLDMS